MTGTPPMAPALSQVPPAAGGPGLPGDADSKPAVPPGRQREIDTRLAAIRARLKTLRGRDRNAGMNRAATASDRLGAAQRHAAEARAAAVQVLASSAEAFRNAAEAHDRVASVHDRTAAAGIGDKREHQWQAARHRAAAATDRQRAERAQSRLSDHERAEPAIAT